jgi:hypothetical protein
MAIEMNDVLLALVKHVAGIEARLAEISAALQASGDDGGPNFYRPLDEYPAFDWTSIGAAVVSEDRCGATVVRYQGREYKRRSHPKYGTQVWFSRGAGRDEEGNVSYVRLVTFAEDDGTVEELPEKIATKLRPQPAAPDTDDEFERAFPRDTAPADGGNGQPVGPTEFWSEFNRLEREGKLPQGLRNAPEVAQAREGGDWPAALKWLRGQMRV